MPWTYNPFTGKMDYFGFSSTADIEIASANAIYLGDPSTDGTWKIVISGNDLEFQRRESGSFVFKGAFQP